MKGQRIGEFEELVLLSIRMHEQDASGVGIQAVLRREANRKASLGAIYAALDRLTRKRCVTSWLGKPTPTRGGRRKRYYALTPKGERALAAVRQVRDAMWGGRVRHQPGVPR